MSRSHKWSLYVRTYQYSHDAILELMEIHIKGVRWPASVLCVKVLGLQKGLHCYRCPERCSSSKLQSPHMIDDLGEL